MESLTDGERGTIMRSYGPDLAALLVVTIWGTSFGFQKVALEEFDPFAFTFLRYLGMLGLGWGVMLWRRSRSHPVAVMGADLPRLAGVGVLGYTLYIPLSTVALSYTTAFSNALLITTAPLFAALLLRILGRERMTRGQAAAMLVSFVGVLVFLSEKVQIGLRAASLGDLISLVAAFFFAAYTVASRPLVARYPVPAVMAYTLTIGAIPLLLLAWPASLAQDWTRVSVSGWTGLAWAIVVPVYIAWTIWGWVLARIGVARTAVFMYLVPIVGGIASWLLFGEDFGALKLVGGVLILGGLALARRQAPPPPSPEAQVATSSRAAARMVEA